MKIGIITGRKHQTTGHSYFSLFTNVNNEFVGSKRAIKKVRKEQEQNQSINCCRIIINASNRFIFLEVEYMALNTRKFRRVG